MGKSNRTLAFTYLFKLLDPAGGHQEGEGDDYESGEGDADILDLIFFPSPILDLRRSFGVGLSVWARYPQQIDPFHVGHLGA